MNLDILFKTALEASWQGSLVILLILVLRPLFGLRVPAGWRSLLWSLVLLRLLVPAFLLPASPTSLQNIAVVDRPIEQAAGALGQTLAAGTRPPTIPLQGPGADEIATTTVEGPIAPSHQPWWRIAATIWLAGTCCAAGWILTGAIRLHRQVRSDASPATEAIQNIWARCCAQLSVRSAPRLSATTCVESPALIGIFRPSLLIPKTTDLSAEDWEHIFLHELAHFRRRDHWTQLVTLLALCAHWFNPLVWLGLRCLRADRELAADEWALRHLENQRSAAYGQTLLKVLTAQTRRVFSPGLVGIVEDGAQMKQRLQHIVAFTPRRLAGSMAGLGITLALAAVVLGRQAQNAELADAEGLPSAETLIIAARTGNLPVLERLIGAGADVNGVASVRGERTALTAAVAANQMDAVRLLLDRGATLQFKPEKGDVPLVVALKKGWRECADFLIARGATCEPEKLAAARGDAPALEKLLSAEPADFESLKAVCEIAAANGHAGLFGAACDVIRGLPEREYWAPGHGLASIAIARGHRAVVEAMMKRGEDLNRSEVMRLSPVAAQAKDMRAWLEAQGFTVPEYTDSERLIEATEREDLPEMRRLLAGGVNVNYRGESNWTPLTKAATWGCPRAVKLLLEHHADPNLRKASGEPGYTALELAKTPEIADLLLTAGAKVQGDQISYPVGTGSLEMSRWFLDHGVNLRKRKDRGASLLVEARTPEILALLVARGGEMRVAGGKDLASLVTNVGTPEALELILRAGLRVDASTEANQSPLMRTLQNRRDAAPFVRVLLAHGADPNARQVGGMTPLMFAKDAGSIDALVGAGADLYAIGDRGQVVTDYHMDDLTKKRRLAALARYDVRDDGLMDVLRHAGSNVGQLSFAAGRGRLYEMRKLLDAGANVMERSSNDDTPLHFAVRCGQPAAVELLLKRGANPNAFDALGYSPAGYVIFDRNSPIRGMSNEAAAAAMEKIAALIPKEKVDPNYRNELGETGLMRGATARSYRYEWMLAQGANVNAQRDDGMTALMLAVTSPPPRDGSTASVTLEEPGRGLVKYSMQAYHVKLLLERGADRDLRNKAGKTALELARKVGNAEILTVMEKTANPSPKGGAVIQKLQ